MTIFVLLIIGLVFLFVTGVIIAIDNRRRKYKKKTIHKSLKITGILCTLISLITFGLFFKYMVRFNGVECGKRTILLRSTMLSSEVRIPSGNAKLDKTLEKKYKSVIKDIESQNKDTKIEYVDALLNKQCLSAVDIHEIKYSSDLSEKQVQIVEYLVNTKDGMFTKPGIYYYIIFSDKLATDKNVDTTKEEVKEKKSKNQKEESEEKKNKDKDTKKSE
ncbi:MAG: hypothetical protein K5895_12750 [Lachnospiraceae bacterium]|jgi:hypothetical protein|nr:hypothetical protein [Lachnospiraceae bacterium]